MDLCSLGLWVWQCHHGFCRLHRLSLPFVMPEIYHEQFEQKMGTPTRHYHHYTDESIIKSGRPMSSALISQPFSLTLPCCTGGTSFMKSNWDDNVGRVHSCKHLQCGYKWESYKKCNYINYILPTAIITRGLYFFTPIFTTVYIVERFILQSGLYFMILLKFKLPQKIEVR